MFDNYTTEELNTYEAWLNTLSVGNKYKVFLQLMVEGLYKENVYDVVLAGFEANHVVFEIPALSRTIEMPTVKFYRKIEIAKKQPIPAWINIDPHDLNTRPDSYTPVVMTIEEVATQRRESIFGWLDSHDRIIQFAGDGIRPLILTQDNWKAVSWMEKPEPQVA
jgi:hypothetical protein